MLAKLFLKPCNLLVMDEPTNDLDIETLELLEERLIDFDGTLLLVSHDRAFIDNVVTQLWVFDGSGHIDEHVGGYSDWHERTGGHKKVQKAEAPGQKSADKKPEAQPETKSEAQSDKRPAEKAEKKRSSSFSVNWICCPSRLPRRKLSDNIVAVTEAVDFYSGDQDHVQATLAKLAEIEEQLEALEMRWLELEEMTE